MTSFSRGFRSLMVWYLPRITADVPSTAKFFLSFLFLFYFARWLGLANAGSLYVLLFTGRLDNSVGKGLKRLDE